MTKPKFSVVFCIVVLVIISVVHCQEKHREEAASRRRRGGGGNYGGGGGNHGGGGKKKKDELHPDHKSEFEEWKKKYGKGDDDVDDFYKWKKRKDLDLSDEDKAEFKKWKADKGKSDEDIAEFLLWKRTKTPNKPEFDPEFIKWNMKYAKGKGTMEEFEKWKKENEKKDGKDEKKEDDLRGTCFQNPTKLMRKRIEHCKCQILHNLTSLISLPSSLNLDMLKSQLGDPNEKTAKGKKKKCKFPPLLEALGPMKIQIVFLIRVCFWKKMKMLSTNNEGKPQMSYEAVKEAMGMFESKQEIIKALQDGIDNCVQSPVPKDAPPIPTFVEKFMSIKDFRKCECVGLLYKKHCTDVDNGNKPSLNIGTLPKDRFDGRDGRRGDSDGRDGRRGDSDGRDDRRDDSDGRDGRRGDSDGRDGRGGDSDGRDGRRGDSDGRDDQRDGRDSDGRDGRDSDGRDGRKES